MSSYQFPGGPAVSDEQVERFLNTNGGDRRALLKRAAALGLAMPALGGLLGNAQAQETPASGHQMDMGTPQSGYVGSNPQSPGTGSESPVPMQPSPFKLYDPFLKPVEPGPKQITLTAMDAALMIAKDVPYAAWTFDGTVPGPMLRVREGDKVDFTLKIDPNATTSHSLDFHSAQTPPNVNYKTIMPGEEFSWSFTPKYPGAFMYHCGTPPVLMHIGTGMYGAMIVDPKEGWPPAQEIAFIQSDFYLKDGENGVKVPDYTKMLGNGNMDYVVFNGYANQYVENPIKVKVGEPIRIFLVNCGPNAWSTFHVVGAIFDAGYLNANPQNKMVGLQSMAVGPGDGICVELTLEEPGEYPAVNHAFGHAAHGAVAILKAE
ncbi:MAG: multicopper oxidase domain-containing protein [Thermomicrobiales bacterium]|nr:multicopper oxidase domain-containing protein [Thermomicrobiales bacterium]